MKRPLLLSLSTLMLLSLLFITCEKDEPIPEKSPETDYMVYDSGSGEIGSAGGEVSSSNSSSSTNGIYVKIPQGALKSTKKIEIKEIASDFNMPSDINIYGAEFTPDGETFITPIEIGIPVKEELTDKPLVFYYNEQDEEYIQQRLLSYQGSSKVITFETDHFSSYVVDYSRNIYLDALLYYTNDGLKASVKFTGKDNDVGNIGLTLAAMLRQISLDEGITNIGELISTNFSSSYGYNSLVMVLTVKLKDKKWYGSNTLDKKEYIVKLSTESDKRLSVYEDIATDDNLLLNINNSTLEERKTFFSGEGLIFHFEDIESNSDGRYYVETSWRVSHNTTNTGGSLRHWAGKYTLNTYDEDGFVSSIASMSTNDPDKDNDGIADNYEPNQAPNTPSNPTPEDNATDIATTVTLSWDCTDPDNDEMKYDIYFGENENGLPILKEDHNAKSFKVSGLKNKTTYYWTIHAKDGSTTMGPVWSFKTEDSTTPNVNYDSFTDSRDGKTYKSVQIGNQVWMAENLAYLPSVTSSSVGHYSDPYYYVYDYNGTSVSTAKASDNYKTYGALYNWPAALTACPDGWQLPSDNEWEQLAEYISEQKGPYYKTSSNWNEVGKHLKSTTGWNNSGNGTDDYGYTGLPGGYRTHDGNFYGGGKYGYGWSSDHDGSTLGYGRYLYSNDDRLGWSDRYKGEGLSVRCIKIDGTTANNLATVVTNDASSIGDTYATLNGDIISNGGAMIEQKGFYWSATNNSPNADDNALSIGYEDGAFKLDLTDLEPNTTYYFRTFAMNAAGISLGEIKSFKTKEIIIESGIMTDLRDGDEYKWVKIGEQIWMAENLAYNVGDGCWAYNNDISNVATYGRLYTWEAAKIACPSGWHIPTDDEWKQLEMAIGMSQSEADDDGWRGTNEGTKLKSTSGWNNNGSSSGNGTDDYGFSALPGGLMTLDGSFDFVGRNGRWWSATEKSSEYMWLRVLASYNARIYRPGGMKIAPHSIRCVKD